MRLPLPATAFAAALGLVTPVPAVADGHGAQDAAIQPAPKPPALVVAISVDQFSADLFAQYRRFFTRGLARLAEGAVFPSGYQSHAATETCPGHSTILTGVRPARNGIIANWWFDPDLGRDDKEVYCAEDESDQASTSDEPVVSAVHLRVPTIGDRLKAANPASRNVAVSAKDRAAVMMGGHAIDAAYWWKGAGFETFKGRQPDATAVVENGMLAGLIARGIGDLPVPEWCGPRDREVAIADFTIGSTRFAIPPGEGALFGRSPHVDAATASLAVRLVDQFQLGMDEVPDVLSVSFSATDFIGHAFGHEGVEMCIQLAQLDETIGRLFDALDERGIDYVAMLTADHGGIDAPERLVEQAYPAAERIDRALSTKKLSKRISEETGITVPEGRLLLGDVGSDIYLSAGLDAGQRRTVALALIATLGEHPQVAQVFHADELAAMPMPEGSPQDWSLAQRVRASFDEKVSGDIIAVLKRGVLPIKAKPFRVSTHGSPWDYDRRVPILFWRKGLAGFEQPAPVETVDIAPTLAALLRLDVPAGEFDGRCLDIDGGPEDTCGK